VGEFATGAAGAFSLDDIGTTEVDDAFSVARLDAGTLRIGIHIAAPALGPLPDGPLDVIARERDSGAKRRLPLLGAD